MNTLNSDLYELARNIGPELISLLTLLICLVIVLARWKRHPRVSFIAALGLFLIILHSLVFSVAYVWLPRQFEGGSTDMNSFYGIMALTSSVTFAIAFAVLLIAVFIDRKPITPVA
jgi:ABC-type Fe3+ transport system permease subunit